MNGDSFQIGFISQLMKREQIEHRTISQNVANVNTPGYRTLEASFDETLDSLLDGSSHGVEATCHQLEQTSGLLVRADGNNVDIDKEMGKLTKNSLVHNAYTQILAAKIRQMQSAISGR